MPSSLSTWIDQYLNTYTLLVLLLITAFGILLFPEAVQHNLYGLFFSATFLSVVLMTRRHRGAVLGVVLAALLLKWLVAPMLSNFYLTRLGEFLNLLVSLYAVGVVVLGIARSQMVDEKAILDAISGYLLLGMAAATLVMSVQEANAGAFSFPDPENLRTSEGVYFSLVTLSTLGYGDIVPLTAPARSVATLTSVVGQMYVAIIVALLVGKYAAKNSGD